MSVCSEWAVLSQEMLPTEGQAEMRKRELLSKRPTQDAMMITYPAYTTTHRNCTRVAERMYTIDNGGIVRLC